MADPGSYWQVSKKTMKVIGSVLNLPKEKVDKNGLPHDARCFYIPVFLMEDWAKTVQMDLRPQDFMQESEYSRP